MLDSKSTRMLTQKEVEEWGSSSEAEDLVHQRIIYHLKKGRTILIDGRGALQMLTKQQRH